jgi:hypothetical protein
MKVKWSAAAAGGLLVVGGCAGDGTPAGSPAASRTALATKPASTAVTTTESPASAATHRTTVVITAPSALSTGTGTDKCGGTGAYAALAAGVHVRVVDGSGALVASAPLGTGHLSGEAGDCTWSTEVVIPTDRASYSALIEGWGSSGALSLEDLYQPIVIHPNG